MIGKFRKTQWGGQNNRRGRPKLGINAFGRIGTAQMFSDQKPNDGQINQQALMNRFASISSRNPGPMHQSPNGMTAMSNPQKLMQGQVNGGHPQPPVRNSPFMSTISSPNQQQQTTGISTIASNQKHSGFGNAKYRSPQPFQFNDESSGDRTNIKLRNTAGMLQPLPERSGGEGGRSIRDNNKVSEFGGLPGFQRRQSQKRDRKFSLKKAPDINSLMVTLQANNNQYNDAQNNQPSQLNFTSFNQTIGSSNRQDFNDYANTIISSSDTKPDRPISNQDKVRVDNEDFLKQAGFKKATDMKRKLGMGIQIQHNEQLASIANKSSMTSVKAIGKDPPKPQVNPAVPVDSSLYLSLGKKQSSFKKSRGDAMANQVKVQLQKKLDQSVAAARASPRNNQEAPPPEKPSSLQMAAEAYAPKKAMVSDFYSKYSQILKKNVQAQIKENEKISNTGQKVAKDKSHFNQAHKPMQPKQPDLKQPILPKIKNNQKPQSNAVSTAAATVNGSALDIPSNAANAAQKFITPTKDQLKKDMQIPTGAISLTDKKVLPLQGKLNPISSSLPGQSPDKQQSKFVNKWGQSYNNPNNLSAHFQPLQQNLMRAISPLSEISPIKSDDTLELTKKTADRKKLDKKKDPPEVTADTSANRQKQRQVQIIEVDNVDVESQLSDEEEQIDEANLKAELSYPSLVDVEMQKNGDKATTQKGIDFGYQASKVKFQEHFMIKNSGQKRVTWRLKSSRAFKFWPPKGELQVNDTVQVSVVGGYNGLLEKCKSYLATIKVYYDNDKLMDRIPMKVQIIKGFHLSRRKITVDQNNEDNVVKIYNFNQMKVIYKWVYHGKTDDEGRSSSHSSKKDEKDELEDKMQPKKQNFLSIESQKQQQHHNKVIKKKQEACKIDFDSQSNVESVGSAFDAKVFQMLPNQSSLLENSENQVNIIFKPKTDEVYKEYAYCHIHKADTKEHLQTLKLKIVGQKKVPKGQLSTEYIDIGELDCISQEPKYVSFQIINTGSMPISYKIHWITSPSCTIQFDKQIGIIPPLTEEVDGENEVKPMETDGPHKQTVQVQIQTSTKARYYGRFQETFFVRIDGTLNWQKLTLRGTIVKPPEKKQVEIIGSNDENTAPPADPDQIEKFKRRSTEHQQILADDINKVMESFNSTMKKKQTYANKKKVTKRPTDLVSMLSSQMESSINQRDDDDSDDRTSFASEEMQSQIDIELDRFEWGGASDSDQASAHEERENVQLLTQSTTMGMSDIAETEFEYEDDNGLNTNTTSPTRISTKSQLLDLEPIDLSKPKQIFVGKNQKELDTITFEKKSRRQMKSSEVGSGGFGVAFIEQVIELDKRMVVNKKPKNVDDDHDFMKKWHNEFKLAMNLNGHKHIIEYMYFIREGDQFSLIMEYMSGGTLQQYIHENAKLLTYDKVRTFAHQLIKGIVHMHSYKIKHQDLKPGNILLNAAQTDLKIIDFGEATNLEHTLIKSRKAQAGTRYYKAPEQHRNVSTLESDVWSYGCIVLQLVTKEVPYHNFNNEMAIQYAMNTNGRNPLDEERALCPQKLALINQNPLLRQLLEKCFEMDYHKRITAQQVLDLPIFRGLS